MFARQFLFSGNPFQLGGCRDPRAVLTNLTAQDIRCIEEHLLGEQQQSTSHPGSDACSSLIVEGHSLLGLASQDRLLCAEYQSL